jgi:hypothetical protein
MSREEHKDAIEVSIIFHEGQRMFAVPKQPAPVQEPACWQGEDGCPNRQACCDAQHCLYTTPPAAQRQWVGLTDKQMVDAIEPLYQNRATAEMAAKVSMDEFRAIEAKLKEKNT